MMLRRGSPDDLPDDDGAGEGGPALTCPHCGEPLETYVDPGGGERQEYVEDCAVCCRPIRFVAVQDLDTGEYGVDVYAEI
jgi:hypothetical protein